MGRRVRAPGHPACSATAARPRARTASRISTGTIASKADSGSCSSSSAPTRPPVAEAPAEAHRPAPSGLASSRRYAHAPVIEPGEHADVVGHVGQHGRIAEGQQRGERDERARADDRVDRARDQARAEQREGLQHVHVRRTTRGVCPRPGYICGVLRPQRVWRAVFGPLPDRHGVRVARAPRSTTGGRSCASPTSATACSARCRSRTASTPRPGYPRVLAERLGAAGLGMEFSSMMVARYEELPQTPESARRPT